MGRSLEKRNIPSAALGAAALLLLNPAFAAPPLGGQAPRAANQHAIAAQQLDLSFPLHAASAAPPPARGEPGARREPGVRDEFGPLDSAGIAAEKRHSFASPETRKTPGASEQVALPAMGADGMRTRPALQDFVRRVHSEGLPVARLFESKSALLHIGLSPKGKPGLWLVQKTH